MRPFIGISLLSILGLVCGAAAGLLRTAFILNCGETCPDEPCILAFSCAIVFPLFGYFMLRKAWGNWRRASFVAIGLSAIIVLPALSWYGHELHSRYWNLYREQTIPDTEYSQMIIAEKSLSSIGIAEGERCVMGSVSCEQTPHTISAICRRGSTPITEKYWSSFKRLPAEDLRGLMPDDNYKNFPKNLCSK